MLSAAEKQDRHEVEGSSRPKAVEKRKAAVEKRKVVEVNSLVKGFQRRGGLGMPWSRSAERRFLAVNHVSFSVKEGEIVGLVGESGSGKTTLGKAILRLYGIDDGQVLLDGVDIHKLDRRTFRGLRYKYQMIFQNPHSSLNPGMRVLEMLLETAALHLKLRGAEADARCMEMLGIVGLADKASAHPSQLSGGEKRRVGLARILMLKPRLVVADEPTAGLDASLKAGIVQLMLSTRSEEMAYLFISHDLHLIRYVANRILVMFRGHLVEVLPEGAFELGLQHHPYTELLLHSFHLGGGRAGWKPSVASSPAENLGLPEGGGCCYYPHCNRSRILGSRSDICRTSAPPPVGDEESGFIACHFV